MSVEKFSSREAALEAEDKAIWNERPKYNIQGARPSGACKEKPIIGHIGTSRQARFPIPTDDDELTPKEVAAWLKVSDQFLGLRRVRGLQPIFTWNGRYVVYRRGDVKDWLRSKTVNCTKEELVDG
jgi:hypothetical protein